MDGGLGTRRSSVAGVLALSSISDAAGNPDPGLGTSGWRDGAGGAMVFPWTWPLVLLGVYAPLRRRPVTV